jgi:hypothetical protein
MRLTASFEYGIVEFTRARLNRRDRQIDFHSPAIIQSARINRSVEERNIKKMSRERWNLLRKHIITSVGFVWGLGGGVERLPED